MSKIGRNDPCHCGSGEKYKRCCQQKDEAAQRLAREASNAQLRADVEAGQAAIAEQLARSQQCTQAITVVLELIQARNFTQAETAAREHMERFPEVPDGYDLMGMLCEARNEPLQAAQWLSTGHRLHTSPPRGVLGQGSKPATTVASSDSIRRTPHSDSTPSSQSASDRAARDQTALRSDISLRFRMITIRDGLHPAPLTIRDPGIAKVHQEMCSHSKALTQLSPGDL